MHPGPEIQIPKGIILVVERDQSNSKSLEIYVGKFLTQVEPTELQLRYILDYI